MSIAALDAVMETAKPGRFVMVGFIEGGEPRVAWGYVDQRGNHHRGVELNFEGAKRAASVYGFRLNGEGVKA